MKVNLQIKPDDQAAIAAFKLFGLQVFPNKRDDMIDFLIA